MSSRFFLPNPSDTTFQFEEDWEIVQWTAEGGATITKNRYQGDDDHPSCMSVVSDTDGKGVYYTMAVDAETWHHFKLAYKNTANQEIDYVIYDNSNGANISTGTFTKTAWSYHYEKFTTPAGCVEIIIYLRAGTASGLAFYVDDLECHGNIIERDPEDVATSYDVIGTEKVNIGGKIVSDETIVIPEFRLMFPIVTKSLLDRMLEFFISRKPTYFDDQVVPSMTETFRLWDETIYNFVGITNPSTTHVAWFSTSASEPSASSDFETTEFSTADYQAIDADDANSVVDSVSTTGHYGYQKYRFEIAEYSAADQIRSISVEVKAAGDDDSSANQDGVALYLWNNTGACWFNAANSRSPDKETLSFATSKPEQAQLFVDTTNGYIWVLLQTQNTKGAATALSITTWWVQVTVNRSLDTKLELLNRAVLSAGDVISVVNLTTGATLTLTTHYTIGDDGKSILVTGQSAGDYIRVNYNQYYYVRCTGFSHGKGQGRGLGTGDAAAPVSNAELVLRSLVGLKK